MNAIRNVDILVLGSGQAGLAVAYFLRETGLTFILLDGQRRLGDSWRQRYDSLTLFSSRAFSALPGMPMPGDPTGYPTKDEVAAYLEEYGRKLALPLLLDERVTRLDRADGGFLAQTQRGARVEAASVIVATGPFQIPTVPAFAEKLSPGVTQFTGASYRRPAQIPAGPVLVVGDGPTGRQVAVELAASHDVSLSTGRMRLLVPQRFLGWDIMRCFEATGALRADKESLHGRFVHLFDPVPGLDLLRPVLRRRGIQIVSRAVDASDRQVCFADGSEREFSTVIWALGYRDDASWLRIPGAVDGRGSYVEERGISPVPGLYHVGRSWQNSRASALITGAGHDAEVVAAKAVAFARSSRGHRE